MTAVYEELGGASHERVVRCSDDAAGLRAIIAVHSTVLGPALGGTRFRRYRSDDDALDDVLRLAAGMTSKAAVAGLDLGGGKAVILGDPAVDRTDELIRAYGRAVDHLAGTYLTAEDVGTTQADMDLVRTVTRHVTGVSESLGGSGDPSPATALGVRCAMSAVAADLWGDSSLEGRRIVVSGVGKVGSALVGHLVSAGAVVSVADIDPAAAGRMAARHGVEVVGVADAHRTPCDILSPCALGGAFNAQTIPELACAAVVGSANNQLAEPDDASRLADAGVLYAPDYVVNAGGVINIAEERHRDGYDRERAHRAIARVEATTATVLATARAEGITTTAAADRVAEERLDAARKTPHHHD
ncbi:MAG TPA: Glu/Leu/Phe/Val dehydrogenase dimerization domain-containing protein [Acidimicrobiales bacterium]|nr:Glu/Leu/Phe/Val dehydrogenase dimerization domain-containing protein [Acidimicrobiales bacterium]